MIDRRWMPGALLLAGIVGCGSDVKATVDAEHEESTEATVSVRTEPARLGPIMETVEGIGRCEALPHLIATLTPAVEGHVHALLAQQGDVVRKEQPIVELDTAVARADFSEKTATRDGLKASLVLLRSLPRPDERRPSELAIEQAKVAVAQAKDTAERLRPLLARHEVSEQQVFVAEKALEQAMIQQQTAEAQLKAMMIGPRPEAVSEAEGRIKTADALVALSQARLDYHTIRAPIDGVLDSLHCHPGETIAIGTPIGEVVDSREVFTLVWLPPRSAGLVRVGMKANVEYGDARDPAAEKSADEEKELEGKVAFVGRVADPQTGNLPIRVLVDNPDGRISIGQSLRVTIVLNERKNVLQVPAAAILDLGEGPVLNVVRDGKAVVLHPQPKTAHGGTIEVAGTDLKEGEPVIVDGGYNLPEGTHIKPAGEKDEDKEHEENAKKKEDEPDKPGALKEHGQEKKDEPAPPERKKTEPAAEAVK